MQDPEKEDCDLPTPSAVELNRIARFGGEVEKLSGMSRDWWEAHHPELIVHLSKRASGIRTGHALRLGGRRQSKAAGNAA